MINPLEYKEDFEVSTWDDPLNQKWTGSVTQEQVDAIYSNIVLHLNSVKLREWSQTAPAARDIEKLYHIASMVCQK